MAPTEGMALLHIHGDKCMLHEAQNVSKGVKYVFRSDVVFAWRPVVTKSSRPGEFFMISQSLS